MAAEPCYTGNPRTYSSTAGRGVCRVPACTVAVSGGPGRSFPSQLVRAGSAYLPRAIRVFARRVAPHFFGTSLGCPPVRRPTLRRCLEQRRGCCEQLATGLLLFIAPLITSAPASMSRTGRHLTTLPIPPPRAPAVVCRLHSRQRDCTPRRGAHRRSPWPDGYRCLIGADCKVASLRCRASVLPTTRRPLRRATASPSTVDTARCSGSSRGPSSA